jgi:hypothetical protein
MDISYKLFEIGILLANNEFACPACPVALANGTGVKCLCV